MKLQYILLSIALIVIVGAIIIIEQKPAEITPAGGDETEQEVSTVFEIGKMAPSFTLEDYDGNLHSLEDYKGKYVMLNLWASWCPFCLEEMPIFQEFYEEHQDEDFEIIAVNRGESLDTAKSYTDAMDLTYPLLLNPSDDMARKYQLRAMPSTYFIDKDGILLEIKHGALTQEMLDQTANKVFSFGEDVIETIEPVIVSITSDREIQETDGVKHSVTLENIVGGGPAKDGIPSIDNPKFTNTDKADELLNDEGLGIAVMFGGIDRFYPFQILVQHEIVNDVIGSQPVLITYCPLCGSGIVFDPTVNGKSTEFGTSGKLWNSNLVMYDRQTDTYWSQILGEAIMGELTGAKLPILPHDIITYEDWKNDHPDGEVLSKDTGFRKDYTISVYGDYATSDRIISRVDNEDDRYHPKEPTYTIEVDGIVTIFPQTEINMIKTPFTTKVGDVHVQFTYNRGNDTIKFTRFDTGETIIPTYGFWFSTIAVHPDAEVFN